MEHALRLLFFSLFIVGCTEIDDSEKPEVVIESPVNGQVVTTDDNLKLVATFTDNTGLLQYKITMNGIDSLNDVGRDSTLSFVLIDGVPKKPTTFYLNQLIELDNTTFNGHYELTVSCVDVEGNESVRDTVRFQVKNSIDSEPPVIHAGGPTKDTLFYGEGFSPTGVITDSQSLMYVSIYAGTTNRSDTLHWFDFTEIQNNEVSFESGQSYWQVDSTWTRGNYEVYYTAWDKHSGVSKSIPFYVKY